MTAPTLNYSHTEDLFSPKFAQKATLFGAGSVGGWFAFFLANMGVEDIEVWDNKIIASHNIPMSVYDLAHVGYKKLDVLKEIIERKSGIVIKTIPKLYTGRTALRMTCVASCVDSMRARKVIWKQVRKNPTVPLFIDTRVAEFYLEVLTINPNDQGDIDRYEALMCTDKQAKKQMCGHHGTILTASRAANIAAQNLTTFWQTGQKVWRVAERCDTLARVF